MKIYTKTGDTGITSILGGQRVSKDDARVQVFGMMDHVNSWVGVLRSEIRSTAHFYDQSNLLKKVQEIIFEIGSTVACEEVKRNSIQLPKIRFELINELERMIDDMESELEPMKYFVLPGGEKAACYSHLCRTETRNLERVFVSFRHQHSGESIPWEEILQLVNRLSDFFFVFARFINMKNNEPDVLWKP